MGQARASKVLLLALCVHEGGIGAYLRGFADAIRSGPAIEVMSLCTWVPKHRSRFRARVAFTKAAYERRHNYNLVIAGHPFLAPIAWAMRRPYVVLTFGIDIWSQLPWSQRLALQHADRVVATSNDTAGRVHVIQRVPASRIVVIRPAVDAQFLEAGTAAVGTPRHVPFTLLTVSRLDSRERYKGHEQVIAALPEIQRRIGQVRYNIAGEGDDEDRLLNLAGIYAPGIVSFYGSVLPQDLHRLYAECDLFVMPSTKEGFGVAYLEAAAHGKPVIAGPGGPEEAMILGVTGYVSIQPAEIADRIVELAQDDAKRIKMGRAGRQFVERHFTMATFIRDVEALLASLSPERP